MIAGLHPRIVQGPAAMIHYLPFLCHVTIPVDERSTAIFVLPAIFARTSER
jgi:hypothetical protein